MPISLMFPIVFLIGCLLIYFAAKKIPAPDRTQADPEVDLPENFGRDILAAKKTGETDGGWPRRRRPSVRPSDISSGEAEGFQKYMGYKT